MSVKSLLSGHDLCACGGVLHKPIRANIEGRIFSLGVACVRCDKFTPDPDRLIEPIYWSKVFRLVSESKLLLGKENCNGVRVPLWTMWGMTIQLDPADVDMVREAGSPAQENSLQAAKI